MENICVLVTEMHGSLASRDRAHPLLKFIDVRCKGVFAFRHDCREEYNSLFEREFSSLSRFDREDMGLGKYYRALDAAYKEEIGMRVRVMPG